MAATWPVGVTWTSWSYVWRTTPVHRRERPGSLGADMPPPLAGEVSWDGIQFPDDGAGPLFHRTYTGVIEDGTRRAGDLIERLGEDPNRVAPLKLARFQKTRGPEWRMQVGDEYLVHMPGPWDGPIRTVEVTPRSFRFATLDGHLEAGQIEWSADDVDGQLEFRVQSWSRSGDRLSAFMHDRLLMAKEVQLYMWTSVVEQVAKAAGGRLVGGVDVDTRRIEPDAFPGPAS